MRVVHTICGDNLITNVFVRGTDVSVLWLSIIIAKYPLQQLQQKIKHKTKTIQIQHYDTDDGLARISFSVVFDSSNGSK